MLTEAQVRKLISANESLQAQLDDVNRMLAAREAEIEILADELNDTTILRSKLDGQLGEIESIQHQLGEKQRNAKGAEEREWELKQELSEMAILNKQYAELIQDYAYLQSQFKDTRHRLIALTERNFELEQIAGKMGELESRLEIMRIERDDLKNRVASLESQRYLGELNL